MAWHKPKSWQTNQFLRYSNIFVISWLLKFIYSEKATLFCKISTVEWLALHWTNLQRRFPRILWPFQNIWTLNDFDFSFVSKCLRNSNSRTKTAGLDFLCYIVLCAAFFRLKSFSVLFAVLTFLITTPSWDIGTIMGSMLVPDHQSSAVMAGTSAWVSG